MAGMAGIFAHTVLVTEFEQGELSWKSFGGDYRGSNRLVGF